MSVGTSAPDQDVTTAVDVVLDVGDGGGFVAPHDLCRFWHNAYFFPCLRPEKYVAAGRVWSRTVLGAAFGAALGAALGAGMLATLVLNGVRSRATTSEHSRLERSLPGTI